jgi:hypothetical protein
MTPAEALLQLPLAQLPLLISCCKASTSLLPLLLSSVRLRAGAGL